MSDMQALEPVWVFEMPTAALPMVAPLKGGVPIATPCLFGDHRSYGLSVTPIT